MPLGFIQSTVQYRESYTCLSMVSPVGIKPKPKECFKPTFPRINFS